jgi:hypothetical protein
VEAPFLRSRASTWVDPQTSAFVAAEAAMREEMREAARAGKDAAHQQQQQRQQPEMPRSVAADQRQEMDRSASAHEQRQEMDPSASALQQQQQAKVEQPPEPREPRVGIGALALAKAVARVVSSED